jgi:CO/xanthine dehydrogenase FAD-binding subunit
VTVRAYYAPTQLSELVALLAEKRGKAKLLAGGTDVLVEMRDAARHPEFIVALYKVVELQGIRTSENLITIGAMTTFSELAASPLIREKAFVLAQAANSVGSPQIRNRGTVGGNIVNASPAGDTVPALMALDAKVRLMSAAGTREILLEQFFLGIGKTKLVPGEVVQEIFFPALGESTGSAFGKLGRRNALAISRVNAAVVLGYSEDKEIVTDCRIAVGAVAPNPFRVRSAEQTWLSCGLTADNRDHCVSRAMEEISRTLGQRASAVYKKQAGPALIRTTLDAAAAQVCRSWEKAI